MPKITEFVNWHVGGEIAGNTSVTACPTQACRWVKFKAKHDNAGIVAVGPLATLTLPAGTDTSTAGWPLAAGEETDWMPVDTGDLADIYNKAENAGDDLVYIFLT